MKPSQNDFLFKKKNYLLMGAGILLIIIGFLLMSGAGSDVPGELDPQVYSLRRILWAPLIVLSGFAVEAVAILYHPKDKRK